MAGFTDIHSHFIYGVDDGAGTKEEMCAMLDAAHANGISVLYATPHIALGIKPFEHEVFAERVCEAQRYCEEQGYALTINTGAELFYTPLMMNYIQERQLPVLGEGDSVLVEFAPDVSFGDLEDAVEALEERGYEPILAHIERYRCLRYGRNAWKLKRRYDVRYQVNCGSVIHGRGFWERIALKAWLDDELIDYVASDAHNITSRPYRMQEAYSVLRAQRGRRYAAQIMKYGERV